jgi:hypothetical protein
MPMGAVGEPAADLSLQCPPRGGRGTQLATDSVCVGRVKERSG